MGEALAQVDIIKMLTVVKFLIFYSLFILTKLSKSEKLKLEMSNKHAQLRLERWVQTKMKLKQNHK